MRYLPEQHRQQVKEKRSMKMTEAQDKCLSWFLMKPPMSMEDNWITYEQWKTVRDSIDLGTASDIICHFRANRHEQAIAQIKQMINS